MKKANNDFSLAFADAEGNVWDFPGMEPAFRAGNRLVRLTPGGNDTAPVRELPLLPARAATRSRTIRRNSDFAPVMVSPDGDEITAASAFLASAYLRTHLPAFARKKGAPVLPLWAYAGVAVADGDFFVPAVRIDEDPRSDPAIHENDAELRAAIGETTERYPGQPARAPAAQPAPPSTAASAPAIFSWDGTRRRCPRRRPATRAAWAASPSRRATRPSRRRSRASISARRRKRSRRSSCAISRGSIGRWRASARGARASRSSARRTWRRRCAWCGRRPAAAPSTSTRTAPFPTG